jgi:maltose alpha-D-glucosyltransferase/alpha-amylase
MTTSSSLVSFLRRARDPRVVLLLVCNFTPVVRADERDRRAVRRPVASKSLNSDAADVRRQRRGQCRRRRRPAAAPARSAIPARGHGAAARAPGLPRPRRERIVTRQTGDQSQVSGRRLLPAAREVVRDSDGDGFGDFRGLTSQARPPRAVWASIACGCSPSYPSPFRDDGYDIADYYAIHPGYGTLDDFKVFLDAAHATRLRVITELVTNHTSDRIRGSRRRAVRTDNPYRDWYVWSDTDEKYQRRPHHLPRHGASNWTWDPVAKAYYWHRFFSHQPDLNYDNPAVREEMWNVMQFWLDHGRRRLPRRCRALPHRARGHDVREPAGDARRPEVPAPPSRRATTPAVLLAEANQWPEDVRPYFGDGDEFHMAFHFPVMPRMFMAVRLEDRKPIVDILDRTPPIPESHCQWGIFLRNHDELTLEMVTAEERDFMYDEYAPTRGADQSRHPPPARTAARRRSPAHRADDRRCSCRCRAARSSTTATKSGWATTSTWAIARRPHADAVDAADQRRLLSAPILNGSALPLITEPASTATRRSTSRRRRARRQFAAELDASASSASEASTRVFGRGGSWWSSTRPTTACSPTSRTLRAARQVLVVQQPVRAPAQCGGTRPAARTPASIPVEMFGNSLFPRIGELPYLLTLGPYDFYWFKLRRV